LCVIVRLAATVCPTTVSSVNKREQVLDCDSVATSASASPSDVMPVVGKTLLTKCKYLLRRRQLAKHQVGEILLCVRERGKVAAAGGGGDETT
jgi:hypothetical protein